MEYIYVAVFDEDCNEHFFAKEEDAKRYIEGSEEFRGDQEWIDEGNIHYIPDLGWYYKAKIE